MVKIFRARTIMLICAMSAFLMAHAEIFSFQFNSTPLPEAIRQIMENHPDLDISFIYNELENYDTNATVSADNAYDALRQTVGMNPVTVVKAKDTYYIEALQHGRFIYTGKAIGTDNEPVAAATVMLLAPKDSTVLTYGIADENGCFRIPCDRTNVIAKLSCMGYKTTYHLCNTFNIGTIVMPERAVNLRTVTVEADNSHLYADRSVYIPTTRQKNASQTGADLLSHMAIPQLGMIANGNITTNSGRNVAVYIDYLPVSKNELKAMNIKDVKKVEYYTSPSDPRFQGNEHVVNFIMQQYEYGGYIKTFGHLNLLSYSEQLLASTRFQYKKMKYDLIASGWNMNNTHYGSDVTETFLLPDESGKSAEFNRYSHTTDSKTEKQQYFAGLKATYTSDKILASTEIDGSANNNPHNDMEGVVFYSKGMYPSSSYRSTVDERSRFISFSGHYYFKLNGKNSLTFTPDYVFSHTEQASSYIEAPFSGIYNSAIDNTNQLKANLSYSHSFGDFGNLLSFIRGNYEYNRTSYSGSVFSYDKAKSIRIGGGATYSIDKGNFYGLIGFGYDYDKLKFQNIEDKKVSPWADLSFSFLIKKKHSLSMTFHYSTWQPSPSYKSDNIIVSSPFMKYTGNPNLLPHKSYDLGLDYTWIPNKRFNMAAFVYGWTVSNRSAFDYEPAPDGILRTIKQPIGSYSDIKYGLNSTARFIDNNLSVTAQIAQVHNHDGQPFNRDHSFIYWHARIRYYLRNWNFSLTYISDKANSEGSTNGFWTKSKNDWQLSIGWSNDDWNVRANIINMTRWNWRAGLRNMQSQYYSVQERIYNGSSHALIQLSATYTFGYGKKVQNDNEPSVSGSASSGILK